LDAKGARESQGICWVRGPSNLCGNSCAHNESSTGTHRRLPHASSWLQRGVSVCPAENGLEGVDPGGSAVSRAFRHGIQSAGSRATRC
jgi:hypothetical protein